jgi:hypothetical protein
MIDLVSRLFPLPRHDRTPYIPLNRKRCVARWQRVAECPRHVLGTVDFFRHRDARVDRAADWGACQRRVAACPQGSIETVMLPHPDGAATRAESGS